MTKSLFTSRIEDIADGYNLEATPDRRTFIIWPIIYLWETLWLIYAITTLFRTTSKGPLYVYPPVMPGQLFVAYILNCVINSLWLVAFDRKELFYSVFILAFIPLCLTFCLVLSYVRSRVFTPFMLKESLIYDIWANRFLLQNGLATNATWAYIATCLNLGMVLTYVYDITQDISSSIVLILLSVGTVLYTYFDYKCKITHYTVTPYMVVLWATSGIFIKHYDISAQRNSILTLCLLIGSSLVLFFKIFSILFAKPISKTKQSKSQ